MKRKTGNFKKAVPKVIKKAPAKEWICPEGCKLSATPCEHLEGLISNPNKDPRFENIHERVSESKIDREYYDSGAGYVIPEGIRNRSYEYKFREKMQKAGLEPIKVDILVLRFVYDQSLRDIAEELGIVSSQTVLNMLSSALASLRKKVKR